MICFLSHGHFINFHSCTHTSYIELPTEESKFYTSVYYEVEFFVSSLLEKSLWELFVDQFEDLLVKILLVAAIISFVSRKLHNGVAEWSHETQLMQTHFLSEGA